MAPPDTTSAIAVTAKAVPAVEEDPWQKVLHVPMRIAVEVPVTGLTVRELFRLDKGAVIASAQLSTGNVPLYAGGRLIGWAEFQVIGDSLGVRLAELA